MSDWRTASCRVPHVAVASARLIRKALQVTGAAAVGLIAVAADQVARSESVLSEWWLDVPLAALVATLVLYATRRVQGSPASFGGPADDGLGEVVFGVSRGRHVHDVLESLTRQACRIMRVERAVVVLRDESDPRSAIVVAGPWRAARLRRQPDRHR